MNYSFETNIPNLQKEKKTFITDLNTSYSISTTRNNKNLLSQGLYKDKILWIHSFIDSIALKHQKIDANLQRTNNDYEIIKTRYFLSRNKMKLGNQIEELNQQEIQLYKHLLIVKQKYNAFVGKLSTVSSELIQLKSQINLIRRDVNTNRFRKTHFTEKHQIISDEIEKQQLIQSDLNSEIQEEATQIDKIIEDAKSKKSKIKDKMQICLDNQAQISEMEREIFKKYFENKSIENLESAKEVLNVRRNM